MSQYKQVFRECLISAALISMGNNWGEEIVWGWGRGAISIHFFRDINIKFKHINITTETFNFSYGNSYYKIVAMETGVTSTKFEQNWTRIDNFGKLTLT